MIKGKLNKSIKATKAFQEYQEPKTKIKMSLAFKLGKKRGVKFS